MATSYIPVGRMQSAQQGIFFVPVIRQRLSSAVLVQRALRELDAARSLNPARDVMAVELPEVLVKPSQKSKMQIAYKQANGSSKMKSALSGVSVLDEALDQLPKISLLYATMGTDDYREVIPVTPCDGVIEALRSAREWGLRTELVDQNIAPGHLGLRNCMEDPDWPDDELALVNGAAWYLDKIQPLLAHPPARLEPVDTYREAHMAEKLRELHSQYERVLFICEATHVEPTRERLLRTAQGYEIIEQKPKLKINIEVADPSLSLRLHFLDDIPRLVEIYERERADGRGWSFTKHRALIQAIWELADSSQDISYSIRNYDSYTTLLRRLLAFEGRQAPRLEEAIRVAVCCFGNMFAARIRRHLLGYYDDIDVDRVGPRKSVPTPAEAGTNGQGRVVSRGCNPSGGWYVVVHPIPVLPNSNENIAWPPYKEFQARMRAKAFQTQPIPRRKARVSKYQGAIRGGIDLRRTLRSYLTPEPTLYVKDSVRKRRVAEKPKDTLEPVVWLFEPDEPFAWNWNHASTWIGYGRNQEAGYTAVWQCYVLHELDKVEQSTFDIDKHWVFGMVMFCSPMWTIEELRKAHDGEINSSRIPGFRTVDPGLQELDERLVPGAPWPEILLEGALAFAKHRIVLVCPTGYAVPQRIVEMAAGTDKRIEIDGVPLSRFTAEECRKLRSAMRIWGPHNLSDEVDRNDPKFTRGMYEQFKDAVEAYW